MNLTCHICLLLGACVDGSSYSRSRLHRMDQGRNRKVVVACQRICSGSPSLHRQLYDDALSIATCRDAMYHGSQWAEAMPRFVGVNAGVLVQARGLCHAGIAFAVRGRWMREGGPCSSATRCEQRSSNFSNTMIFHISSLARGVAAVGREGLSPC